MFARALALCLLLSAGPVLAAESGPVRSPRATATLVTDTDAAAPGVAFHAGLRLRLAPGWHVYWRNPGAAGMATEVEPTVAGGAAGVLQWPAPERLTEADITVYGYTGEVVLPFAVTPAATAEGAGVNLSVSANWLVCQSVCVPEEGRFDLSVSWGTPSASAQAPLLAAAEARVPGPAPFEAVVSPSGVLTLSGPALRAAEVQTASFFPDTPDTVADGAAQDPAVADGTVRLRLTPGPAFKPETLTGVVVLLDLSGNVRAAAVTPQPGPEPVARGSTGLLATLLAAFAGGLLLNLMPCVFPVLAMKAAGLARLGGAGRRTVRMEALSYTAGVLGTFCTLGTVLALAGTGWGAQFQSPAFVAGAAWLMFAVGLNLSGVWTAGAGLAGAGSGWAGRTGHAGAFATGALAVLVAAPCTAPFMGTAVAAALALPAGPALGVFAAMGAGLAAPYLLLAAVPGAARVLPRPGRWMEVLKGVLAFPMYAAAAWLLWVVSTEAGPPGVLLAGGGLVLVGLAAWLWNLLPGRLGPALAVLPVLVALGLLPGMEDGAAPQAQAAGTEPFSTARLAALRAEGRPVFVDMTASWCIPCLLNERIALSPEAVRKAFADRNVALLRGDWTRKDPAITAFLRSQDRDGVPLYVFYPPGGAPVVLPQLLTAGIVLEHIAGRS